MNSHTGSSVYIYQPSEYLGLQFYDAYASIIDTVRIIIFDFIPENITESDADAIKKADEAYNALSEYEQSILDKNAKKKLDNAKSALEALNNPTTGDNGKMWMWFALLFVSGGGLLGTTAYRRKRKETEN